MTEIPSYTPRFGQNESRCGGIHHPQSYIVFDIEAAATPGRPLKRVACLALLTVGKVPLSKVQGGTTIQGQTVGKAATYLMDATAAIAWWVSIIHQLHAMTHTLRPTLIAHSAAFDILALTHAAQHVGLGKGLLDKVLDLVEDGVFRDTMHRAKLVDLGTDGNLKTRSHGLVTLVKRYFSGDISAAKQGPDAWRLRYNELLHTPIEQWPQAAIDYPISDVVEEWEVYRYTAKPTLPGVDGLGALGDGVQDELRQMKAGISLSLGAAWGMRTDKEVLTTLYDDITAGVSVLNGPLVKAGILRLRHPKKPDLAVNQAEVRSRVSAAYNGDPPMTPPSKTKANGQVKIDKETLESETCLSDPALRLLAKRNTLTKRRDTFVVALLRGADYALCPRYSPVLETGRASSSGPNVQNIPRAGGLRESIRPRKGYVFVNADYDSLELRCWAEVCEAILGYSTLAEWYRKDPDFDPHTFFAGKMLSPPISYEEAMRRKRAGDKEIKALRTLAKVPNFGYPGGMGPKTLREQARKQGTTLSQGKVEYLKEMWLKTWAEAGPYLAHAGDVLGMGSSAVAVQYASGRIRAGVGYCQLANTWFQGLAGDGAKEAVWLVTRAMYTVGNPLSGSRMVAFVHDELLLEVPIENADAAADMLVSLMVEGMERLVRHVPIRCEASVSTAWSKSATSTRDKNGHYSIWSPPASA